MLIIFCLFPFFTRLMPLRYFTGFRWDVTFSKQFWIETLGKPQVKGIVLLEVTSTDACFKDEQGQLISELHERPSQKTWEIRDDSTVCIGIDEISQLSRLGLRFWGSGKAYPGGGV